MKRTIELSENDYRALKEDGVQNHLALADSIIAHSVPYEERSQGEWTPVSEGLPERYTDVIVTDIEISNTYQSRYVGNGYWECDNGTLKNRIIAWMPLPEPYKKGGAEE